MVTKYYPAVFQSCFIIIRLLIQKAASSNNPLLSPLLMKMFAGMRGVYRGAIPNAQRAAVVNGVQIPTYDVMKRNLIAAGFEV